jgi:hypothetical protein
MPSFVVSTDQKSERAPHDQFFPTRCLSTNHTAFAGDQGDGQGQ